MISARTRVFALLGNPVAHSLSPAMHNAAFQALGMDVVYVAVRCDDGLVSSLMEALCQAGGGGNLTVPHKRLGARVARAAEPGPWIACNTFWEEQGHVIGASTDAAGILAGWDHLGRPPGAWLILGTGGSAAAAAQAAVLAGAPITVRSRAAARRLGFEAECQSLGAVVQDTGPVGLALNCTPLGLKDTDPAPLAVTDLPPGAAVLDLVYRRGETRWVVTARAAGRPAVDGRVALLAQGVAAFQRWFPRVQPPAEVMDAALRRALA